MLSQNEKLVIISTMIFFLSITLLYTILGFFLRNLNILTSLLITQIFIVLLPSLFMIKKTKMLGSLFLKKSDFKISRILLSIFSTIPLVFLGIYYSDFLGRIITIPESYLSFYSKLLSGKFGNIYFTVLVVGFIPGLCEEVMFRGYILERIGFIGKWKSIIFTALLFSFYHLDIYKAIAVFLIGIWLGYLKNKSGSLLYPIIIHSLYNTLSIIFTVLMTNYPKFNNILNNSSIVFSISSGVIFFVLAFLIFKQSDK